VAWINGYLKWRIKDLYTLENQYAISLDRLISNDDGSTITLLEQVTTITLDLLEVKIVQIQEEECQRLGQKVRQYIQQDQERKLTSCHPRKHPECNCQLLVQRLLLQQPPEKIADIARELDVNNQTVYSHWKKNCIPLLQEIGRRFGYQR
jgi:Fic family protein